MLENSTPIQFHDLAAQPTTFLYREWNTLLKKFRDSVAYPGRGCKCRIRTYRETVEFVKNFEHLSNVFKVLGEGNPVIDRLDKFLDVGFRHVPSSQVEAVGQDDCSGRSALKASEGSFVDIKRDRYGKQSVAQSRRVDFSRFASIKSTNHGIEKNPRRDAENYTRCCGDKCGPKG